MSRKYLARKWQTLPRVGTLVEVCTESQPGLARSHHLDIFSPDQAFRALACVDDLHHVRPQIRRQTPAGDMVHGAVIVIADPDPADIPNQDQGPGIDLDQKKNPSPLLKKCLLVMVAKKTQKLSRKILSP